ncbi:MAG: cytochrome-c peroxidase [Saprospiraceae bacterium]|nr:MAG: cytochrome-c peroxidase [Saprospiraceae bacterium]
MKKSLTLGLALFALIWISGTVIVPMHIPDFLPPEDCLELPETLFNYADIQLPPHLTTPALQNADNTPADNPITDEGATLGRVLFYDPKLSVSNTQSCASCHKQEFAFTDNRQFSRGFQGGFTRRNSTSLSMARFYANQHFFWDERAIDLEAQTLMPIQDPLEMGMTLEDLVIKLTATEYYPPLFAAAFGTEEITTDRMAKAMAQFIRSMVSYQSEFDAGLAMVPAGTPPLAPFPNFTAQENLGKAVFFDPARGNCGVCHGTTAFVLPAPRNNGLDAVYGDNGVGEITGITSDNGFFKVPSLRNVEITGPFMHDGRFENLEDVIEHYNSGVQNHPNLSPVLRVAGPNSPPRQLNLTNEEKSGLVAFLKTLTDFEFISDERWSDPFCDPATTGLDDLLAANAFTVSPNPAKESIHLQIKGGHDAKHHVKLIDAAGKLVFNTLFQGADYWLDIQSLPSGVYFLQLETGDSRISKKVVKH